VGVDGVLDGQLVEAERADRVELRLVRLVQPIQTKALSAPGLVRPAGPHLARPALPSW
jgi:hypothetical protein